MKPLLQWMSDGDPGLVPVLMGDARSTAAACLGLPLRLPGQSASFTQAQASPVTPEKILQCSRETGIAMDASLGSASHLDVMPFMADLEVAVREETAADGAVRRFTTLRTPAGELSDVFVTPPNAPACWTEHLVKSGADLPALAWLIEETARLTLHDPRVREALTAKFRAEAWKWPADVPLVAVIGVPAFVLTCSLYVDPTTAFYLMADHPLALERLYEALEQAGGVWLRCAADAGADVVRHAINGLELYSPDIYRRHFIPQARRLHRLAHDLGMRTWVHTCGHMGRLIEMGVYDEMDIDVLESLSSPPLGTVADLRAARAKLGGRLVTRGAVNVDYFYSPNLAALRAETRRVLDATRGWRHMIGDTNDSFPPYPRENILALVDEVAKSGRLWSGAAGREA